MSDWERVTPTQGSVSVGPAPDGWERIEPPKQTAYDRFLNAIEIPKMGGVNPVVGPMVASGTGELIKGAGALTELAFPETGRNISRLGETITSKVKEQYPVSGTIGQIGSYAVPYSAAQKAVNLAKATPQAASKIASLGKIPSFALASGEQAAIGGATGYALTPDSENRNQAALYGTVFGGATPAIGGVFNKAAEFLRGRPPSPQMAQNVQAGQEAGYVVPPTQVKPSLFNRLLEGTAGKLTTAQNASYANQEVTNKLAKKALGMSNDTPLTFENLDNIIDKAGQQYTKLRLSGRVVPDQNYTNALDDIVKDARLAEKDFPKSALRPEVDLIESLKSKSFDANSAVSQIMTLRKDADNFYKNNNSIMGNANKQAANAIEDAIEAHLAKTGQKDVLQNFRDARQLMAKTYTVKEALNPASGTIDAAKLAAQLRKERPLTGELEQIAKFSSAFPKATQTTERMGSLPQMSPLDVIPATAAGGISYFTGHETEAGPLGIAALALRPAFRAAALSKPVQKNLLSNQSNLSPDVRNLIKMLSTEGAIKTGANRPIEESK
jgi:hypothetical protein